MSKGSRQSLVELENLEDEIGEDEFPLGLGCALELFREKDEVEEILVSLPQISTDHVALENVYEKYQRILDRYQEQPHLLDKHIENMIDILISQVRASSSTQLKHVYLKFLRQIFKVRGPKEVVKRMPHEIADLVPVLNYLEKENLDDPTTWESGYVLVMWLSILVINPFHLKLLDGQLEEAPLTGDSTTSARLMSVCKKCLVLNSKIGQAAPFLVARFLTRPDMQEVYMSPFITWCCSNIQQGNTPFGTRVGSFAALSAIFKIAKRQEIIHYSDSVLNAVMNSEYEKHDTVLRKSGTKLIQRIGMVFLRTKIAPWRYQRGSRSLVNNLAGKSRLNEDKTQASTVAADEEDLESYHHELALYSEAIESIIDKLLEGLKDKDTVVRWSAAKGIGRVTNRLPKDYADEVVEGLLQMFSPRESNGAWHGGCLAIAELARRGLLLPERLDKVIPVVKKALIYDEIRGNFSVGSHVRDAACYVLWAFARAFEPKVVEPYVHDIATSLINVIVFDREVNCRRAASAAFQENVGRQGNFPHGIDIVTVADYFSIGNRQNAFINVSLEIGKFCVYTKPMIDHLLDLKFNHFDGMVRELAADALGKLGQLDPEYMMIKVLPRLIPSCWSADTYSSNGALYSVGHILVKVCAFRKLDESTLEEIRKIIPAVAKRKVAGSAKGNELIRQGLCFFITCLAQAKIPFHDCEETLNTSYHFLVGNIPSMDNKTKSLASTCLQHYFLEYYYNNPLKHSSLREILDKFSKELKTLSMPTRQGFANTLGKLPHKILQENFSTVFESLLRCSQIQEDTSVWAESRRDAVVAITNILSEKPFTLEENNWQQGIPVNVINPATLYHCLLQNMEDYTTDKRGDIGSWVREAAMSCLKVLTIRMAECCKDFPEDERRLLPSATISQMIGLIARQSVEKIDNIRVRAGKIFSLLLYNRKPQIKYIPHRDALLETFPEDYVKSVNWRSTSQTFPRFVSLLNYDEYISPVLTGFIVSGGSLSDSVMKDANGAVKHFILNSQAGGDSKVVSRVGWAILKIFEDNLKVERITLPLLKFLSTLLQSNVFTNLMVADTAFGRKMIDLVKAEVVNTSRVEKIVAAVDVLCELIQGPPEICKGSLRRLMVYLCHSYPRIRLITSQKLYEAFITYGDDSLDIDSVSMEEIMSLLSETQWDIEVSRLRLHRNRICDLLNVPQPNLLKPSSSTASVSDSK